MFSSIKAKITSGILILPIMLQSFPGVALGYDVLERLRNFVSAQVKTSDGIINPNKQKIKESFQKGADWYEGKWLGGLSFLESKTGLNEQNKVYHALKSYNLFSLGFNAGVVNGAGSLAAETYSLAAKIPTAPERLLNFGFNYADDPEKYHAMVTNGARLVAGIALNALPLLEQGKNAYLDAAQDPLKFGHLNGEGAAFVGSFLIGGGQVKALSSANKVEKVAEAASAANKAGKVAGAASAVNKAERIAPVASLLNKAKKNAGAGTSLRLGVKAPIISSPLDSLISGFKTLVADQRATMFFAPDAVKGPSKFDLMIKGTNGKTYFLGSVENGVIKHSDEADFLPQQLRALNRLQMFDKQLELYELRIGIENFDSYILAMVKSKEMSLEDGRKCLALLDLAHLKTKNAIEILHKEQNSIREVQLFRNRDLKEIYSEEQLGYLEGDVVRQIKTLERSEAVSKGLLLEYKKLLGKVRLAQKEASPLKQLIKKDYLDVITEGSFDALISPRILTNFQKYFSPVEMEKLLGEVMKELDDFIIMEKRLTLRGDEEAYNRLRGLSRTMLGTDTIIFRLIDNKGRMEKRLAGTSVTESLLAKSDLGKPYTLDELSKLQLEVEKDIAVLSDLGTNKDILGLNQKLLDRIKEAIKKPTIPEGNPAVKKAVMNPDEFLLGVNLKGLSQAKLKQLEQEGKDLLKHLEDEETKLWQNYRRGKINEEESIDLLMENYQKQDRLRAKLDLLTKRYLEDSRDI